jgi:hypothetical protein
MHAIYTRAIAWKFAVTFRTAFMVTVHVSPEVESQPDQPAKLLPALVVAVSVTTVPFWKAPVQVPPFSVQLMLPGWLVTCPCPKRNVVQFGPTRGQAGMGGPTPMATFRATGLLWPCPQVMLTVSGPFGWGVYVTFSVPTEDVPTPHGVPIIESRPPAVPAGPAGPWGPAGP